MLDDLFRFDRWGEGHGYNLRSRDASGKVTSTRTVRSVQHGVVFPHWCVVFPSLALPALWVRRRLRDRRRRRLRQCPRCGYDLRATPGRCPECGQVSPAAVSSGPATAAEPLEPRRHAGGMVALTPGALWVATPGGPADGMDASLFGEEEDESEGAGSGFAALDDRARFLVAPPPAPLTAEADPLSDAGDPAVTADGGGDVGTLSSGSPITLTLTTLGSATEADPSAQGVFRFSATASGIGGPPPSSVTVNFTRGGTAQASLTGLDGDYKGGFATATSVTIPVSGTSYITGSADLTFNAVNDTLDEPTETVTAAITGATANNGAPVNFGTAPVTNTVASNDYTGEAITAGPVTLSKSGAGDVPQSAPVKVKITKGGDGVQGVPFTAEVIRTGSNNASSRATVAPANGSSGQGGVTEVTLTAKAFGSARLRITFTPADADTPVIIVPIVVGE